MSKLIMAAAFAMGIAGAGTVLASQDPEVMATVRQFVNGFNKGDAKMARAACIDQTVIIDDFPPHAWRGAGATSKWLHDYDGYAKKNGITNGFVTLGKPRHVDVTGGDAYVVVPTTFTLKKKGEVVRETGLMTLVLHKGMSGWRISAWSWADD